MMLMAINLIIRMVIFCFISEQFKLVNAGGGKGWMPAHAKFYGEAYGTSTGMGKLVT